MPEQFRSTGRPCCDHHRHHHAPPPPAPTGAMKRLIRPWRSVILFVIHNRFAIAAASLIWLLWRSGPQPRRIAYPCQRAAAANLGFLSVLFIPELARRHAARRGLVTPIIGLATGSIALAGALFLLMSMGKTVYSDYLVSGLAASIPAPAVAPPPTTVGIQRTTITHPTADNIEAMVRAAVARAGGLTDIVHAGESVTIKPNLVNDNLWTEADPTGVTTDPRIVAAVVKLVKEAGATTVRIADGAAGPANWNDGDLSRAITWSAFRNCGYATTSDPNHFVYDPTVELVDLNDAGTGELVLRPVMSAPPNTVLITLPNGVIRSQYYVPKAILKPTQGGTCDVLITVPTLKNHMNGNMTCALKSRVGCAPSDIYHVSTYLPVHSNQMKWDLVHWAVAGAGPVGGAPPFPRDNSITVPGPPPDENTTVHYSIVDLNLVRPNDFAVIDALVGITNGPTGGTKPSPLVRTILAGRDSVAIDTVAALTMGYDPLQLLQIGWAWNRGLGNRDTADITVIGDHVNTIRQNWPTDSSSAGAPRADSTPPTIADVQPADNTSALGDVVVTGSGISADVVKAELTVKLADGLNLVANGGFENGSTNWTPWQASWSSGVTYDYNNAEAGRLGSKCLKFYTASQGSFGVYQQVPVTPGKTYRLDAYWKGKEVGLSNWYELILIDGPFTMDNADQDPGVRDNYMYAYDKNTFGLTADFGWTWAHDQNAPSLNQVDWNNRQGLRTATGSVLTVVLKCGACCDCSGPAAWFDNVSLVEAGEAEQVVATVAHPTDPFSMVWHSDAFAAGNYELKITVYDAALNEAGITRHVSKNVQPSPLISATPIAITATGVLTGCPPESSFTVANSGVGTLAYRIEVDQPWLAVPVSTGVSTGQANAHTVTYACDLPVGAHHANLIIRDNGSSPTVAPNEPVVVPVTLNVRTVSADFDKDGDVDLDDFSHLQLCLTGDHIRITDLNCFDANLDGINDVSVFDVEVFRRCLTGADTPATLNCGS